MKRILLLLAVISVVIYNLPSASASLIVENFDGINVTIQEIDPVTKYYWYWDLTRFTDMTYSQQLTEIATINVPGLSATWHMALLPEITPLWTNYSDEELMKSFAPTEIEIGQQFNYVSWQGRYEEVYPFIGGYHYRARLLLLPEPPGVFATEKTILSVIAQSDSTPYSNIGAWVVSTDALNWHLSYRYPQACF